MSDPVDLWYRLYTRSRSRMGITMPPFQWRYLLHWWGWRWYVLSRVRKRA